ncbi:hypothetical protein ACGS9J_09695 [Serratia quinivorans]
MSISNSPIEGTTLISGTLYGGIASTQNGQNVYLSSSPIKFAHTGDNAIIYDNIVSNESGPPGQGAIISCLGNSVSLFPGNESKSCTFGYESTITISYIITENTEEIGLNRPVTCSLGDNTTINVENYVSESVILSAGYQATINCQGSHSTLISTGDDVKINNAGNDSLIMLTAKSRYIDMLTGKDSSTTYQDSIMMAFVSPEIFILAENGAAVIAYHDGSRKRFVTVYAGEDGIEPGIEYTVNEQGNVVPVI